MEVNRDKERKTMKRKRDQKKKITFHKCKPTYGWQFYSIIMLYSTQVSTKRETERALPFLWEHFGLPERAKLSYRSISISFESSWYQQRRGANSQSITIKWKQSSCTYMINITQYSQHNIQIPLHSLRYLYHDLKRETQKLTGRDGGWYERKSIER